MQYIPWGMHMVLGPISLTIFHHNPNVMEISFCSHPNTNKVIATIFGTWHDSWAVVACAKFCCDMITSNWIRAKWNFHRIWIVMEKSLVKWVLVVLCCDVVTLSIPVDLCDLPKKNPGPLFTKKTPSYGYRDPHYKPKVVWRPSQLYNGNPYTDKTASS